MTNNINLLGVLIMVVYGNLFRRKKFYRGWLEPWNPTLHTPLSVSD